MPRTARVAPGGMVFHVLNRGIARMQVFEKAGDYEAFERTLCETLQETPMRICAYCVLPNEKELEALRRSVHRGRPYGAPEWQRRITKRLGLESAYRPTGRPRAGNRKLLVE